MSGEYWVNWYGASEREFESVPKFLDLEDAARIAEYIAARERLVVTVWQTESPGSSQSRCVLHFTPKVHVTVTREEATR